MIESLYTPFQHWSEGGSLYIISDPHFGDLDMAWRYDLVEKIPKELGLCPVSKEEKAKAISEYIVWKINQNVYKNDTLIILGDIGDVSYLPMIKSRYKILIKGNHDAGDINYKQYFDEIFQGPVFISDRIVLSHEPLPVGPYLNIHGHDHKGSPMLRHLNCCCELNRFIPLNLKKFIKDGGLKDIKNIHREYIDGRNKTGDDINPV